MPNTLTPAEVRQRLEQVGFNGPSVDKLMGVNPELAMTAARAKELYEASHPGKSFQIEQGFRSKIQQQHIAALGSNYTNASGKKGHESPHQFGQAFDFHILENGVRQPNDRENDNDYKDVANSMRQAAQELGYADRLNYGALGDVHVGRGRSRHPDWGHIEEKRQFWNRWHPGQGVENPNQKGPREGVGKAAGAASRYCGPCVQQPDQKQVDKTVNIFTDILKPLPLPFSLRPR